MSFDFLSRRKRRRAKVSDGPKSAFRNSGRIFPNLLIIPALLPLILVILLPGIRTIFMSFNRLTFGLPAEYVGLGNYSALLKNAVFQMAFRHTVFFSFSVVAGNIIIGLLSAVVLSSGFKFQRLYISLIMTPFVVSEVVAIIIWKYMLEPDMGIINYALNSLFKFGQINWAGNPAQAWAVIIILRVWMEFPFSFLILYSSLISIPSELYESAFMDGAGNLKSFRFITVPLLLPSIMVASIFSFIFAFRNFGTVWILTRGGPVQKTEILSTLLYKEAFSFWEFGSASAIAIIMTIITFLISGYYLKNMYRQMFVKK